MVNNVPSLAKPLTSETRGWMRLVTDQVWNHILLWNSIGLTSNVFTKGFCQVKKIQKSEKNSKVGGWVMPQLEIFFFFGNVVFLCVFCGLFLLYMFPKKTPKTLSQLILSMKYCFHRVAIQKGFWWRHCVSQNSYYHWTICFNHFPTNHDNSRF